MLFDVGLFVLGLILLYFGAEGLVGGASGITLRFGVKPLVVGLTVVAFGTSSPELLVCLTAAIEHTQATDAISVGNILGSNIANIALILGCASLIRPLKVTRQAVRREYPLMLGASFLLAGLIALDSADSLVGRLERIVASVVGGPGELAGIELMLTRLDGAILLSGMIGYLIYAYVSAVYFDETSAPDDELDEVATEPDRALPFQAAQIALGIAGLALGAYWMVESSVRIANDLGVPEIVIGISIVALGTSLPELATSVVAAFRDEADISVGNVIGSNLFNIMLVLGLVSLIAPIRVDPSVLRFDLWMMIAVALLLWPVLQRGETIQWWEGALMLTVYFGYIFLLFTR